MRRCVLRREESKLTTIGASWGQGAYGKLHPQFNHRNDVPGEGKEMSISFTASAKVPTGDPKEGIIAQAENDIGTLMKVIRKAKNLEFRAQVQAVIFNKVSKHKELNTSDRVTEMFEILDENDVTKFRTKPDQDKQHYHDKGHFVALQVVQSVYFVHKGGMATTDVRDAMAEYVKLHGKEEGVTIKKRGMLNYCYRTCANQIANSLLQVVEAKLEANEARKAKQDARTTTGTGFDGLKT
jgi:hypothetical protein